MLHSIKNIFFKKDESIDLYIDDYNKISSHKEALIIVSLYGLFGVLWVVLLDTAFEMIITDIVIYRYIQSIKGSVFVFMSMIVIYVLVNSRAKLLQKSIIRIQSTYKDLRKTYDELLIAEEKIKNNAYKDSLTGLSNRIGLENEVKKLVTENHSFAFIHLNVDNFKFINDTLGHSYGDQFLMYVANKFRTVIQSPNTVARLGSDEFGILLINHSNETTIKKELAHIIGTLNNIWVIHNHKFYISISAGIVLSSKHRPDSIELLFRNADLAMNIAKKEGKSREVFFKPEMLKRNSKKIEMAYQIQQALEAEDFRLYYQPQFNLASGKITGLEALIRWEHQHKAFISPAEFISIAEETGQIFAIEKWVFKTALRQKQLFEKQGLTQIEISINLSSRTLTSDVNFQEFENIFHSYNVNYSQITLEITETALLSKINLTIARLTRLKKLGLKIALDDFGTGYSSLNHLKILPIDSIKLDRSFVKCIAQEAKDSFIIKSILSLSHDLNYTVIAEGIETQEQFSFLKLHSCNIGQGYLMIRPLPIEELTEILNKDFHFISK